MELFFLQIPRSQRLEGTCIPQPAALGRYIVLPFSASRSVFLGWLSVHPTLPSPGQPQAKIESSLSCVHATACKHLLVHVSVCMSESMGGGVFTRSRELMPQFRCAPNRKSCKPTLAYIEKMKTKPVTLNGYTPE